MDGAGLSDREQRALSAIEAELKGDRSLDRILRSTSHRRQRTVAAWLLGAVAAVLFVAASVTVSRLLIWVFAVVWTSAVILALPLVGQWLRRRRQGRDHTPAGTPTTGCRAAPREHGDVRSGAWPRNRRVPVVPPDRTRHDRPEVRAEALVVPPGGGRPAHGARGDAREGRACLARTRVGDDEPADPRRSSQRDRGRGR